MSAPSATIAPMGFPVEPADLESAALTLRSLACRLLRDLLEGSGRGLEVPQWFPRQEAAPFGRFPFWWLYHVREHVGNRLPWAWPEDPHGMLKVVTARKNPDRFATKLHDRLAWHRRTREAYAIPEGLWAMVASAAWNSLDFHCQSAQILTNHLRTRLIVAADDLPVPHLRPEALWLLIASAPVRRRAIADRLPPRRRARRAIAHLQAVAESLALDGVRTEAADGLWVQDVWGQWLAWHIWRTWDPGHLAPELLGPITRLPLIAGDGPPRGEGGDRIPALVRIYDQWYPAGEAASAVPRWRAWLKKAARAVQAVWKRDEAPAGQGAKRV